MKVFLGLLFLIFLSSDFYGQTAPSNFVFTQQTAAPFNYTAYGYGSDYSLTTSYNIFFGTDALGNPSHDAILASFVLGGENYNPITLSNNECYSRVVVNRIANPNVSDLDKQTIFFEISSISGNNVYFTPSYADIQESVNNRIMNRGGDNVFYNDGSDQTKNNIERIDLIIDGGVFTPDNSKAGFVVNERGGNDNFQAAAITSLDASGNVDGLGNLVSVSSSDWGNTGKSVLTTVFHRDGSDTYMRPNQNLTSQNIYSVFISYSDLGIANNATIYGIAIFADDVNSTMDLIGLSDVPLNTASLNSSQGGLDLMGGGGYFGSESVIITDLEVSLNSDDMTPETDSLINLSIKAINNGPLLDSNIIITTTIPSGFSFNSLSPSYVGNVSVVGNAITWTFDELIAYNNESLIVQLSTHSIGGRVFNSSIGGDRTDVNLANNSDSLEVQSEDESTMPVEWLNIYAEHENSAVNINWSTASEINNSRFEIQRSKDSKEFETIGFVSGSGNSNQVSNYQFTDYSPNNEILYYRIKQVDFDGNYKFSEVLVVKTAEFEVLRIYPNPTDGFVKISGLVIGESIEVYNNSGQTIKSLKVSSDNTNIDLKSFSKGVYFVKRLATSHITKLVIF